MKRLRVAILGTGNIGTDLLVKCKKSDLLNCVGFVGRRGDSKGLTFAEKMQVNCSTEGLDFIKNNENAIDLVFDATSANAHLENAELLEKKSIPVIDLTPAKLGKIVVPSVNPEEASDFENINMVTCGGQASIPIANAMGKVHSEIEYIEVVSSIASLSAGPATRLNLDEYIATTEHGIMKFSGAKKAKAILILNPAQPSINMQTTVFAKIEKPKLLDLKNIVQEAVENMKVYVPGIEIIEGPKFDNGRVFVMIKVIGRGDYLPTFAGNLDIINCAAIAAAEIYCKRKNNIT